MKIRYYLHNISKKGFKLGGKSTKNWISHVDGALEVLRKLNNPLNTNVHEDEMDLVLQKIMRAIR